jgi:hypothetical protein
MHKEVCRATDRTRSDRNDTEADAERDSYADAQTATYVVGGNATR